VGVLIHPCLWQASSTCWEESLEVGTLRSVATLSFAISANAFLFLKVSKQLGFSHCIHKFYTRVNLPALAALGGSCLVLLGVVTVRGILGDNGEYFRFLLCDCEDDVFCNSEDDVLGEI
jgi:hypothetical protein